MATLQRSARAGREELGTFVMVVSSIVRIESRFVWACKATINLFGVYQLLPSTTCPVSLGRWPRKRQCTSACKQALRMKAESAVVVAATLPAAKQPCLRADTAAALNDAPPANGGTCTSLRNKAACLLQVATVSGSYKTYKSSSDNI